MGAIERKLSVPLRIRLLLELATLCWSFCLLKAGKLAQSYLGLITQNSSLSLRLCRAIILRHFFDARCWRHLTRASFYIDRWCGVIDHQALLLCNDFPIEAIFSAMLVHSIADTDVVICINLAASENSWPICSSSTAFTALSIVGLPSTEVRAQLLELCRVHGAAVQGEVWARSVLAVPHSALNGLRVVQGGLMRRDPLDQP